MTENIIDPSKIKGIHHLSAAVELYTKRIEHDELVEPYFEFYYEAPQDCDPLAREEFLCKAMAETLQFTLGTGHGPITWGQKPIMNSEKTRIYALFRRAGCLWPTEIVRRYK